MTSRERDRRLKSIVNQLANLEKKRAQLVEQRDELLRDTPLFCETSHHGKGCGKKTKVRDLVCLQPMFYEPPYSCNEGGYWVYCKEIQWDCPKCGHRNRAYSTVTEHTKEETGPRPYVLGLKKFFKEVQEIRKE